MINSKLNPSFAREYARAACHPSVISRASSHPLQPKLTSRSRPTNLNRPPTASLIALSMHLARGLCTAILDGQRMASSCARSAVKSLVYKQYGEPADVLQLQTADLEAPGQKQVRSRVSSNNSHNKQHLIYNRANLCRSPSSGSTRLSIQLTSTRYKENIRASRPYPP